MMLQEAAAADPDLPLLEFVLDALYEAGCSAEFTLRIIARSAGSRGNRAPRR
jgi:hypothetical protein